MFDKCKFPLLTAFYIVFKISTKKKGISTLELHPEFGLRKKKCWDFNKRVQTVLKSSQKCPLIGEVHVDEFFLGGPEKNQQGRGAENKRLVVVAVEKVGVGRAYVEVIENASSKVLAPFFKLYIAINSMIITDKRNGCKPLLKDYLNMKQIPSSNGNNLPDLHVHIMNLKGWLIGIHYHCSREHLQGYLDEFRFRHNRRNYMDAIFHKLMERMVNETKTS